MMWLPGMLSMSGYRVIKVDEEGTPTEWTYTPEGKVLPAVMTGHGTPAWCGNVWSDEMPDRGDQVTAWALEQMPCW